MIRINLLGEEKDRSAAYAIHALLTLGIGFFLIASGVWVFAERSLYSDQLASDLEFKQKRLDSLKKTTSEVDTLEKKQKLLKEKLGVIAQLKLRKQGPVRVLDLLTIKTPEKVWLTTVQQRGDILEVSGVALDGHTVSDYMTDLTKSTLIADTKTVETEIQVEEGIKLQKFKFPAKLQYGIALNPGAKKKESKKKKGGKS